jgi:hypothetical protein
LASRVGELVAECVDPALERGVEHVAEHQHAALHPLARAAEFRVAELGHAAVAVEHGDQHVGDCILAEAVTAGDIVDDLPTLRV